MENKLLSIETLIQLTSNKTIKGHVVGVCIRNKEMTDIEYNIVIWVGSERKDYWVKPFEIEIIPSEKQIGFKPESSQQLITT